jgi:hypothetical protein
VVKNQQSEIFNQKLIVSLRFFHKTNTCPSPLITDPCPLIPDPFVIRFFPSHAHLHPSALDLFYNKYHPQPSPESKPIRFEKKFFISERISISPIV